MLVAFCCCKLLHDVSSHIDSIVFHRMNTDYAISAHIVYAYVFQVSVNHAVWWAGFIGYVVEMLLALFGMA